MLTQPLREPALSRWPRWLPPLPAPARAGPAPGPWAAWPPPAASGVGLLHSHPGPAAEPLDPIKLFPAIHFLLPSQNVVCYHSGFAQPQLQVTSRFKRSPHRLRAHALVHGRDDSGCSSLVGRMTSRRLRREAARSHSVLCLYCLLAGITHCLLPVLFFKGCIIY